MVIHAYCTGSDVPNVLESRLDLALLFLDFVLLISAQQNVTDAMENLSRYCMQSEGPVRCRLP